MKGKRGGPYRSTLPARRRSEGQAPGAFTPDRGVDRSHLRPVMIVGGDPEQGEARAAEPSFDIACHCHGRERLVEHQAPFPASTCVRRSSAAAPVHRKADAGNGLWNIRSPGISDTERRVCRGRRSEHSSRPESRSAASPPGAARGTGSSLSPLTSPPRAAIPRPAPPGSGAEPTW